MWNSQPHPFPEYISNSEVQFSLEFSLKLESLGVGQWQRGADSYALYPQSRCRRTLERPLETSRRTDRSWGTSRQGASPAATASRPCRANCVNGCSESGSHSACCPCGASLCALVLPCCSACKAISVPLVYGNPTGKVNLGVSS